MLVTFSCLKRYEFVGKNTISSNVTGTNVTEDIAECERIQVQPGDVLGVYFPHVKLGVEWSKCQVEEQPDYAVVRYREHEHTLKPGKVVQFQDYGCMKVSLTGVVGPVGNCTVPAVNDKVGLVTWKDRVAVGQEVEYKCRDGFHLMSGDLKRRCGPCRELEGIAPVCGGGWSLSTLLSVGDTTTPPDDTRLKKDTHMQ